MNAAGPAPPSPHGAPLTEELLAEIRRLKVRTRRRVDNLFSGEYHSAFRGRGIEFAEVREYQPGDDVRAIDWNVTARAGSGERAFIKRFVEERQLTVMLAVDQSGSGDFGSGRSSKSRTAAEVASVLALAATRNQDRVGLAVFTDSVELFLPPARGPGQAAKVVTDLLTFRPTHRGTDLAGVLGFLGRVLRRRAVVFIISDFLAEGYDTALRLLAAKHDAIAVTITDPRERELPPIGLARVRDGETGRIELVDLSAAARGVWSREQARRDAKLDATLRSAGVDRIAVRTDRPFVPEIAAYFKRREKRR